VIFAYVAFFFILFAISRAVLRYRDGAMSWKELVFWLVFWGAAISVVVWPGETARFATILGIQRGADAVVYASIILIYYLVFRIYIKLNVIGHDITRLVRAMAVDAPERKASGKESSR